MLNNKIKSVQDLMTDWGLIVQKNSVVPKLCLTHPSVDVFNRTSEL